jgi:hypothetical protein
MKTDNILYGIAIAIILYILYKYYKYISNGETQIDAVITYVNFKDPLFRQQLQMYSDSMGTKNSTKTWRWFSNDEGKYCIKSIKKYAPFFRKIFLVVAGPSQIPEWIKEFNGVTIVYHSDFYKNKAHLPTFNSMSIEHNLHRIEGLSEYFVYFNDDVFLCKPTTKDDFIEKGKIIIGSQKGAVSPVGEPTSNDIGFVSAWKNTNKLLDNIMHTKDREIIKHIPQIQRKSDHIKIIKMFPDEFEKTSSSKFRNTNCNLMSAGMAEWYAIYNNTGIQRYNQDAAQFFVTDNIEENAKMFENLKNNRYKFLNMQSSMTKDTDNIQFKEFLEDYFK